MLHCSDSEQFYPQRASVRDFLSVGGSRKKNKLYDSIMIFFYKWKCNFLCNIYLGMHEYYHERSNGIIWIVKHIQQKNF